MAFVLGVRDVAPNPKPVKGRKSGAKKSRSSKNSNDRGLEKMAQARKKKNAAAPRKPKGKSTSAKAAPKKSAPKKSSGDKKVYPTEAQKKEAKARNIRLTNSNGSRKTKAQLAAQLARGKQRKSKAASAAKATKPKPKAKPAKKKPAVKVTKRTCTTTKGKGDKGVTTTTVRTTRRNPKGKKKTSSSAPKKKNARSSAAKKKKNPSRAKKKNPILDKKIPMIPMTVRESATLVGAFTGLEILNRTVFDERLRYSQYGGLLKAGSGALAALLLQKFGGKTGKQLVKPVAVATVLHSGAHVAYWLANKFSEKVAPILRTPWIKSEQVASQVGNWGFDDRYNYSGPLGEETYPSLGEEQYRSMGEETYSSMGESSYRTMGEQKYQSIGCDSYAPYNSPALNGVDFGADAPSHLSGAALFDTEDVPGHLAGADF